ncbi:MAG: hypothetical protein AAGJ83_08380 [Planctomycetota bacterium]
MLSGGALFNHLDYSFYVGSESGDGKNDAPGGGGASFRQRLGFLKTYVERFDFIKLAPDPTVVAHAPGLDWQASSQPGKQYSICFSGKSPGWIDLRLPPGKFNYEVMCPLRGRACGQGHVTSRSLASTVRLSVPDDLEFFAIRLIAN